MGRHRSSAARRGKRTAPVRTGLLGVTAAAALGVVAVASGLVPVGDNFVLGGSSSDVPARTAAKQPAATPAAAERPSGGGGLKSLTDSSGAANGTGAGTAQDSPRAASGTPRPKPSASASASPAPKASAPQAPRTPEPRRSAPATAAPTPSQQPDAASEEAAEAEVLALVNQARAQAGCRPVRQHPPLAALAGAFSKDMAERNFFDHTDPSGANPWDRARNAGIGGLAAENIARGQTGAKAVMAAWLESPGHRANILNCEFRTLGVGAHFAAGGPWWTQDFGR
ncbi:CAP domain-containing protein [Streptomyces bambusae]|uniref:CAP domain-containing protein n=1 Tax=Streptomyces bambusae TaxID=1550616 RepID=UPI001CFE0B2B|nr:CAP domain-containing protein [Streptomyces bambusae]MCB5168587.1 CAP domain-containing protein [Streptomyces bambusae]